MKFNYIKSCLLTLSVILSGLYFTSCKEDITLDPIGNYGNIEDNYGAVRNITGAKDLSVISIFGSGTGTGQLYFELSQVAKEAVSVQLKVDEKALESYNKTYGTSYELYPAAKVALANDGKVTITAGDQQSERIDLTVSSNGGVGNTYALPISAELTVGGAKISTANKSYIYLIKPYAPIPSSDKGTGIKSILYVEVNDENILNAGEYTMKGSDKPFFDVVNIFAANINFNSTTGRVYVNCNDNVSFLLKNADQYIRPLQAKGIKVVLTILGNHDEAGVANLSKEAAADFARELKSYVDVYGLDGIDFDDEYSTYNKLKDINDYHPSKGYEYPVGGAASARLVYECRQLMPDKIISWYDYEDYYPRGTVEGVEVGKLLTYSYWGAYADWSDRSSLLTGLDKKKYGPSSFNLDFSAGRSGFDLEHSKRLRPEGYGFQMFYNLKTKYDYSEMFDEIGKVLFDNDVEWTRITYSKNSTVGTVNKPSYESYIGDWKTTSANSLFYYYAGPWWDWSGSMKTNLTIKEKTAGQSYEVLGWYGTENDLPLIANYNAQTGRFEIHLPQKAIDKNTGKEWLYLGRNQYPYNSAYFLNYPEQYIGYSGIISNGAINLYAVPLSGFKYTRTMSAVQLNAAGNAVVAVKGATDKDVVWQPFSMTK